MRMWGLTSISTFLLVWMKICAVAQQGKPIEHTPHVELLEHTCSKPALLRGLSRRVSKHCRDTAARVRMGQCRGQSMHAHLMHNVGPRLAWIALKLAVDAAMVVGVQQYIALRERCQVTGQVSQSVRWRQAARTFLVLTVSRPARSSTMMTRLVWSLPFLNEKGVRGSLRVGAAFSSSLDEPDASSSSRLRPDMVDEAAPNASDEEWHKHAKV